MSKDMEPLQEKVAVYELAVKIMPQYQQALRRRLDMWMMKNNYNTSDLMRAMRTMNAPSTPKTLEQRVAEFGHEIADAKTFSDKVAVRESLMNWCIKRGHKTPKAVNAEMRRQGIFDG